MNQYKNVLERIYRERKSIQERKAEWQMRGKAIRQKKQIESGLEKYIIYREYIRMRKKQVELEEWMKKNDCDVCALN